MSGIRDKNDRDKKKLTDEHSDPNQRCLLHISTNFHQCSIIRPRLIIFEMLRSNNSEK